MAPKLCYVLVVIKEGNVLRRSKEIFFKKINHDMSEFALPKIQTINSNTSCVES